MTDPHHTAPGTPGNPGPQDHPRLTEALKALYRPAVAVPPGLDAEIITRARWRMARPITRILPWALPLSAAAAIAWAVWLPGPSTDRAAGRGKQERAAAAPAAGAPALALREDFDHSGRVDILDAFGLALKVDRGGAVAPEWDLNRDGAVDRKDADTLALSAVRVGP